MSYHIIQGIPVEIGGKYIFQLLSFVFRIIEDSFSFVEFPHMAAIAYRDEVENKVTYDCGGSLISKVTINTLYQNSGFINFISLEICVDRWSLREQ